MSSKACKKAISQDLVQQFCSITGSTSEQGERILEACDGNLEMAIGMHMDDNSGPPAPAEELPCSSEDLSESNPKPSCSTDGGATGFGDEEVRAPIPQKREVLVQETYSFGNRGRRRPARSVFDGFRDFQAEAKQEEELLEARETIGIDYKAANKKRKTLEDLFRPPIDLMHKGTFHSAKVAGESSNRWLMVNLQNVQEFTCQALNRDLWSNSAVKSIIQQHFVFWQVYHDSVEGNKYIQFYKVVKWPYIAILDPRTGENMVIWNKLDPVTFCDLVTDFLVNHPSPDGTAQSPPSKKQKREDRESIVDASEDSQLEAAIKASLGENSKKTSTSNEQKQSDSESDDSEDDDIDTFTDSEGDVTASPRKSKKSHSPCKAFTATKTKSHSPRKNTEHSSNDAEKSPLEDTWKKYLGSEEDSKSQLVIRLPNNSKEQVSWPCTSKLKILMKYVESLGFSSDMYELVTNFPRRKLSELDLQVSLKEAGLYPQETIFLQER